MKLAQKLAITLIRARLNMLAAISTRKAAEQAFELFCTPFRKSKKDPPPIFQKAEKLGFDFDGITIKGHRWNHPKETKVLIVHGFESTSANFDRYIVPLINKGYEVLAFDAPAHGLSGGKRVTLPLYVDMIRQVYHLYGPVTRYFGHSFGGLAISHFLETISHDHNTRVVLIAPATESVTAIDSFFNFVQLGEKVRKEFDQIIYEKGGVWPNHYSIRRAMRNIRARVSWFHDEDDDMTPISDALKVQEDDYPNVQFYITKGFGHRRIYRENKVVKKVLEFL